MEDRQILLNKLKPTVRCTVDRKCWCAKLETKIPYYSGQCLSPQEMLDLSSSTLPRKDVAYLKTLTTKEFVPTS
jgi:hypothetical protein